MRTLKNQKGFTLIELIMVIVIIGILSAVAVPKYFSITKDAEYATVQGMVGALNAAAAGKFAYNRLCEESGNCTYVAANDQMATVALLGAQLDPVYSAADYPGWTLPTTTTFVYTGSTIWTCTLTAETDTNRAKVVRTTAY